MIRNEEGRFIEPAFFVARLFPAVTLSIPTVHMPDSLCFAQDGRRIGACVADVLRHRRNRIMPFPARSAGCLLLRRESSRSCHPLSFFLEIAFVVA